MTNLTEEERRYYDALATAEAWDYALNLLNPLCSLARETGSAELWQVMEGARVAAVSEHIRAVDAVDELLKVSD
jgi:hypothetical protein